MVYGDEVKILVERKVYDDMGGYTTKLETESTIMCKVAPYSISEKVVLNVPNPWSSVKFFTQDDVGLEEDAQFFLEHNNKIYKRVLIIDYGKCTMIIGERHNR